VPITTHLHGGHTPASSDGYPTDLFWPGESRTYRYPNHQHAATLWYHDHRADHTAEQVWMGLAGLYVLHDDIERALPLPTGAYDVPLVIQDRLFEPDGAFSYPTTARDLMEGVLGNVLIVNGRPQPYFEVAARRYRFRILNGSNARTYRLSLSSGGTFTQVASGGGLLPHPVDHTSFMIGPGERYEMVVDFSTLPVGSRVVLQNELGSGSTAQVMRFDVTRHESDPSSVPADLAPYTLLDPADATVTRRFTLDRAHGVWTINSLPWDPDRVDASPALGDAEVWEFHARGGPKMVHTMHLHLVQFQVLSRNGAPPESWESGWKDTVFVAGGDTVRVITRFSDYRGRYPFHCHILEHEDHAMMAQFETV
jgi:spore coat protein A